MCGLDDGFVIVKPLAVDSSSANTIANIEVNSYGCPSSFRVKVY